MDAASDLMLGIFLLLSLYLIEWTASILSGALEGHMSIPVAIALLMLGLVGAILALINNWAQDQTNDVDA